MSTKTITCGSCDDVITGKIQFHECNPALKRITEIGKRLRAKAQRYMTFATTPCDDADQMAVWSRAEATRLGTVIGEIADAIEGKS